MAPATPVSLPPQQAVASTRDRFPVPEAMQLRFGSKVRQTPEPLPVRPTHDGQAERPLPPGAYMMAPRNFSWEPRLSAAAPPPDARPPIGVPAQRFPLPEAYALTPSDKAAEEAAYSGQDLPQARPPQHAAPQRFPVMDVHILKPFGQDKEGASHADLLCCPTASCLPLAFCVDSDELPFFCLPNQPSACFITSGLLWICNLQCESLAVA